MPNVYFPAILYPADKDGLWGVVVEGLNINVTTGDSASALEEAANICQEVIDDLVAASQPIIAPPAPETVDCTGGTLVMIPASLPGKTVRINVTMTEDLIKRIDSVAANRSAFLAQAARAALGMQ